MIYIAHRINSINELAKVPFGYGVEVDLRDFNGELVLQHDPYVGGENFESFLKCYSHAQLILNVKSEGIEMDVLNLLKRYNIDNYFFLDCSFPMIVKMLRYGENRIALRFSEFEKIDTIIGLAGKIDWIWVDCFNQLPLTKEVGDLLRNLKFRLCLVSPELQNRVDDIKNYKDIILKKEIIFDAICTKLVNIEKWQ